MYFLLKKEYLRRKRAAECIIKWFG